MLLSSLSKARGAASRLSGLSTQYRHFKLKPGQIGVERHTAEPVPPGGIAEPGAIKPPLDHHKAKQVVKNLEARPTSALRCQIHARLRNCQTLSVPRTSS